MLEVKVVYGVSELARMCDMSTKKVERVLKGAGVPVKKLGGVKQVFLSDLKEHLPELWDSIVLRCALNGEDE